MQFRRLTKEDLPWFLEIRNECRKFLHDSRKFTLKQCQDWFDNLDSTSVYYAIIDEFNQRPMGYFRLKFPRLEYLFPDTPIMIGADLHKDYRGRGLGEIAYYNFFHYLPKIHKGANRLTLEVLSTNLRAYNLYLKLGFRDWGSKPVQKGKIMIPSIIMQKDIDPVLYCSG